ncbi:MAG TPA: hypothetical protein VKF59_00735 [Candidatus Dormibacteraeota bacterium]|nr:hypothetical protein [Candidatus Dormibacteraeota bacterium]
MSGRQVLGGAAILVVLAAVLWYVVVAPRSGAGVAPGGHVRVALDATAVGTGSWERYVIDVRNLADGTFSGDVFLLDQGQQNDQSPAAAASPIRGSLQLPAVPSVPTESAYRLHVTVPSRTARQLAVLAPGFFDTVEAVMGGSVLDQENVDRPAVLPVAVLSNVDTPAKTIAALHYDQLAARPAQFDRAVDFPSSALGLAGYAAIVIDRFDAAALSQAQVQALRDFVGFGGTLVLAGGASWTRTIAPLPADLLPERPTTTTTVSLAPVAALSGVGADPLSTPAAAGSLGPGARTVLDAGGAPLATSLAYGEGQVVELAWDPADPGLAGSPYPALGWSQALARVLAQPPSTSPMATTVLGPDPAFTALLPAADDAPLPPLWLMTGILLLYVLAAGPAAYLLVTRRLGRPGLFWAAVPAVAVVVTGAFYLVGGSLQGGLQDHEIQVLRVGPDHTVNALEYHRILFLRRGNHVVAPAAGSLVAPLTLETYRTTGSTCERCTSQLGGLAPGTEHAQPDLPLVNETGVVYGTVRVVASSTLGRAPVGLSAQLAVIGGRIQGSVANLGTQPIGDLELFASDGQTLHEAVLARYLPAGARVNVDAQLVGADATAGPATAESILLRSVAAPALTGRGEAQLVGLTAPLPSRLSVDGEAPPQAAIGVVLQAVPVASADGSLRELERKSLAGVAGGQQGGFSDVYDIQVPATTAPLTLTWNAQWATSVELWDWTSSTFVAFPSPASTPLGRAALPAPYVHDGLLRVRMHEPRVSWGGDLWVDVAQ